MGLINCPYMYPPIPAAMMMKMGFTPMAHISRAEMMGIQQLTNEMPALLAKLNVGTAINATTAGRMPLNMAAIHGTSMKRWKNIAINKMMKNEGNDAPMAVQIAPRTPRSL